MYNYLKRHNLIYGSIDIIHNGTRDNPRVNILKDKDSGLIFLDEIVKKDYSENNLNYWNSSNIKEARQKTFNDDKRRFELIKNYIKSGYTFLDYGCGNGGLLHLINEEFKIPLYRNISETNIISQLYGIEKSKLKIKLLNEENFNIYDDINKVERKIGIICMFHVLEHLSDPIEELIKIKDKMYNGGKLIIEVPNANDVLINLYDCQEFKEYTFWSEHLILYTRTILKKVIELAGFKVDNIYGVQRYSLSNHLHWLSKGKPNGHNIWNMLSNNTLDKEYEKQLDKIDETNTLNSNKSNYHYIYYLYIMFKMI
jgi:SAM-dependent methyltransferase